LGFGRWPFHRLAWRSFWRCGGFYWCRWPRGSLSCVFVCHGSILTRHRACREQSRTAHIVGAQTLAFLAGSGIIAQLSSLALLPLALNLIALRRPWEYNSGMADIFSTEKRRVIMSAIKGKGSALERHVAKILRKNGISFRSHPTRLPGKPDFVLPKSRRVVFVDSCFWHGCRYHGSIPKSNRVFWKQKIARNRDRDREINRQYRRLPWRVVRIWEHSLRAENGTAVEKALSAL